MNVTLMKTCAIQGGWKEVTDTQYNASQSFVYSCPMTVGYYDGTPTVVQGTVELQFFLFETDTQVSVGAGLLPFTVTPDLSKFSLRVTDYPWQGREDRQLEVRMSFSPALNRSTRSDNTPQEGITTFKLFGQQKAYPDKFTQVRLVEAVEIDGVLQTEGGVSYKMEDSRSRLVMVFSHFTSELLYDPGKLFFLRLVEFSFVVLTSPSIDMGVLLGEDEKGGGSSDNTALIVCLAVILPVAAGIVILAGAAILVGYFMHKKRFPSPSLGGVELSEDHL